MLMFFGNVPSLKLDLLASIFHSPVNGSSAASAVLARKSANRAVV
jgi:hypothetical protein